MKHLKIAGLCLVLMFVMGMALAGDASAALLWLLCLESTGLTKYEDNQCTKASGTGKWQSLGLPSGGSDTVRLLGFSLVLIDKGVGVSIHCPDVGSGWGLIESGKLVVKIAEIKNPVAEGCKLEGAFLTCNSVSKLESIEAVHLPWTSEIFETEAKNLAKVKGTGGGPGWSIRCAGVRDECIEATGKPEFAELLNGVTKGVLLVLARAESRGRQNCTVGGSEKGETQGVSAVLLWNGNGLSLTSV
jgi:hypothetical protein